MPTTCRKTPMISETEGTDIKQKRLLSCTLMSQVRRTGFVKAAVSFYTFLGRAQAALFWGVK